MSPHRLQAGPLAGTSAPVPSTPMETNLAARRRKSLLTNLLVLLVAAVALLCFIAVLADVRRVGNAMRQATAHAESYNARLEGGRVLLLNAEPQEAARDVTTLPFEWIAADEAWALRDRHEPALVAWSGPIFRLFGRDGRAVVTFHRGRYSATWMTNPEFDVAKSQQSHWVAGAKPAKD